jgi:hypothetical protein
MKQIPTWLEQGSHGRWVGERPPCRVQCLGGRLGHVMLLIRLSEHDRIIEHDLCVQGFAQTGDEKLDMVFFKDVWVAAGEHHESFGELIDDATTPE